MHEIAPELTSAVAQRITTTELHERALRDLGAFVHRTVVEDEHAYAVRIDDGALLDGAGQIEHARAHLAPAAQQQAAGVLGCTLEQLDSELDALAARAKTKALKVRVDGDLRERARAGRYAYVHDRGPDFAAGIWVIDPVFMLDVVHEQLKHADDAPAREQAYFAGAARSTTTSCGPPAKRTASTAPTSARARPTPSPATSASATTSAPG